jgi:ketosteroid isomerase-like protein
MTSGVVSRQRGDRTDMRSRMPTSTKKDTVERYLDGFRRMDHAQILECLTDAITWTVFGAFHLEGKAAYDAAIDGSGFSGNPDLTVVRLVEEGDTVMAEMIGSVPRDDGSVHRFSSAEVFVLRDGLICERRAWVVVLNEDDVR